MAELNVPFRVPVSVMIPTRRLALLILATPLLACGRPFELKHYPQAESLYTASLREFQQEHWDNAILGFEKLTMELPARDTLLSRSHYYLGRAHQKKKEHLLAAQSFSRLTESFPDDTLADDALFEAGRSYAKMWRRPTLDAQYGQTAVSTYRTLLALYPNSALRVDTERAIARLEEMMATKDYETGMYYIRRKYYEPAILYFRDVIQKFPNTNKARMSYVRLARAFRAIRYRDDLRETCQSARELYPQDAVIQEACADIPRGEQPAPAAPSDTTARIP